MTGVLQAVSEALVQTVAAVEPAVVRVEARQRLPASGVLWPDEGSARGEALVVTSHHVVERDHDIRVGLPGGRAAPARLIGRDPGTDLALLRVEAGGLTPAAWAESDALAVGALVLALGRPGSRILATFGVISALDENWQTPHGGLLDHYVQTDAAMYPGFSGGALVDAEGRVLGVTTSALISGLSLAIPTATVRRTVAALLEHRRVRRGYLGITAQPVPLPHLLRERLRQETGLLLIHVEPNSPAESSHLIQGDTLVTLNGQPLRSLNDLMRVLHGSPGAALPLQVVRAGQLREIVVTPGERA